MKKVSRMVLKPDLVIKITDNGAYVIYSVGDMPYDASYVFDTDGDIQGYADMFWDIIEHIGNGGNYDRERVVVKIEHGRKYECKEKDCPICKGDI